MPTMYDRSLVRVILLQIAEALQKIADRFQRYNCPNDFTDTAAGQETLDSICMLFIAVGESLKSLERITEGELLASHPEVDWRGAIGFRDISAHQYSISTRSRCAGSAPTSYRN